MTPGNRTSTFPLPPPAGEGIDLLIIAGEHSGDQHAATLVRDLRRARPGVRIAALGGPELKAAGAQLLYDLTASSVVGLAEVLRNYSFFKALFDEILRWTGTWRPRAVCFVDYPGMNLRLARAMQERGLSQKGGGGIRTLYYISPQIWAWKAGRRFEMAKHLDAMAVIFPFEVACYADTSLPVEFVGHPFLAEDHPAPVQYDPQGPVLLLPGSRRQAVARIFPVLLAGHAAHGDRDAIVLHPSDAVADVLRAARPGPRVRLQRTGEVVSAAAVLTSSGTMSMHCALAGIPGAIAYRANSITYWLARMLIKVPYLGIANLLLEEPMYPEYIQNAATPAALAREIEICLTDPERRERTKEQSIRLRATLRQPASGTAGEWMIRQLELA